MNQTPNFQLNQWEKSDRIMMEDFNADNAKIEAALAQEAVARAAADTNLQNTLAALNMQHVITGSYTGVGKLGRIISLPFTPKFVILLGKINNYVGVTIATSGIARHMMNGNCNDSDIRAVENGIKLSPSYSKWHNDTGNTEFYIAAQ